MRNGKATIPAAILLALLLLFPASAPAGNASVTGIRFWNGDGYTRVAIDLDADSDYVASFLQPSPDGKLPPRIVIDLKNATIREDILRKPVEVRNGLLKVVRAGRFRPGIVRVVVDLEKVCGYQTFTMVDPYRVIVDVDGRDREEACAVPPPAAEAPAPSQPPPHRESIVAQPTYQGTAVAARALPAPPPEPASPAASPADNVPSAAPSAPAQASERGGRVPRIRVMLDPGHGGKDPGAIGQNGLREKDVVLEIGKLVRERLLAEGAYDVRMTRDADVFIPLEERTALANKAHADLFVSLHINASPNRRAEGISTYVLSRASTDRESLELAARENGVPVAKLTGVKFILDDLTLHGRKKESLKLAKTVNDAIVRNLSGRYGGVQNLGLKQAPFYVLVGAKMTAVLVESSFISNEREERRLKEKAYLETIADSVVEAIRYYGKNGLIVRAGL